MNDTRTTEPPRNGTARLRIGSDPRLRKAVSDLCVTLDICMRSEGPVALLSGPPAAVDCVFDLLTRSTRPEVDTLTHAIGRWAFSRPSGRKPPPKSKTEMREFNLERAASTGELKVAFGRLLLDLCEGDRAAAVELGLGLLGLVAEVASTELIGVQSELANLRPGSAT